MQLKDNVCFWKTNEKTRRRRRSSRRQWLSQVRGRCQDQSAKMQFGLGTDALHASEREAMSTLTRTPAVKTWARTGQFRHRWHLKEYRVGVDIDFELCWCPCRIQEFAWEIRTYDGRCQLRGGFRCIDILSTAVYDGHWRRQTQYWGRRK